VRSAKAYVIQFLTLPNAMYSHSEYLYWMCITDGGNIGKCTGGWKAGSTCGDSRKMRNVISHSLSQFHNINLNLTTVDILLAVYVYVSFRSRNPNRGTVMEALKALQENNIDIRQLARLKTDHCQQAKSSKEEWSCKWDTSVGFGTQRSVILNILDNWIYSL
jgi:hypothetical protein